MKQLQRFLNPTKYISNTQEKNSYNSVDLRLKVQHDSGQTRIQYQESKFCLRCQPVIDLLVVKFRRSSGNWHGEFQQHSSLTHLLEAAWLGCHLCSIIVREILQSGSFKELPFQEAMHFLQEWSSTNEGPVSINLTRGRSAEISCDFEVAEAPGLQEQSVLISKDDSSVSIGAHPCRTLFLTQDAPNRALCGSTGDPESLALASAWLNSCLHEHSGTCPVPGSDYGIEIVYPARLLYLGNHSLNENARIVSLSKDEKLPDYLSLSYVWGKKEFFKLRTNNLKELEKKIDLSILPKTIQDAITVTKSLGYEYIWIDSICIIQDSKSDWQKEAVKMGDVYRNSVLTIAALGATGAQRGCFLSRNPLLDRDCKIPGTSLEFSSPTSLWENVELERYGRMASPLNTRGWTLQERLTPVRTLYYGASGIFWECLASAAHESDPAASQTYTRTERMLKRWYNSILLNPLNEHEKFKKFQSCWRKVLEYYTSCDLTFLSDKPVAISGVAKGLSQATGYQYCYLLGIWIDFLPYQLCWVSYSFEWLQNAEIGGRIPGTAPTWSWISVRQAVTDYLKDETEFSSLINVVTKLEGLSQKLSLEAHLRKIKIYGIESEDEPGFSSIFFTLVEAGNSQPLPIENNTPRPYRLQPDVVVDEIPTYAWYMALGTSTGGGYIYSVGLILKEIDCEARVFERIGITKHQVKENIKYRKNDNFHLSEEDLLKNRQLIHLI